MAGEALTLDPTAEGSGTQFLLDSTNGIDVLAADYPPPKDELTWASSARTEGARLANQTPGNRDITVSLRVTGTSGSNLLTRLGNLQQKLGKLKREGGTLQRTVHSSSIVFDVLTCDFSVPTDNQFLHSFRAEVQITFTCKPYGRGAEVQLGSDAETTLPVAEVVATGPDGDVPALGRLVITDAQGADQSFVAWGIQSRYYSAASTAALFFQAEDLTNLGTAADAVLSGASGGSVVTQGTLTTSYAGVVSLQHPTNGYPSHVGDFNVWVRSHRPATNTGVVSMALEWGVGDFTRVTRNSKDAVTFAAGDYEGSFVWSKLGQVHLPEVSKGTQRWDGRVIAKSTVVGDDLSIDCVWLQPTTEGSGEIRARQSLTAPTAYLARDEFTSTTSGSALGTRAAPVGGNWAGSGDTDDFTFADAPAATDETLSRSAVSDTGSHGRLAILGTANYTAVAVAADFRWTGLAGGVEQAVIARYVDTNNYLVATLSGNAQYLALTKVVGGTFGVLEASNSPETFSFDEDTWYRLTLAAYTSGLTIARVAAVGSETTLAEVVGYDSTLATGGTLATGKPGLRDRNTTASAATRYVDNFAVWTPAANAAVFASQSLEVRHDAVEREDSGGTLWVPITTEGGYCTVPPAGQEARSVRVSVLTSRGVPDATADPAIDDKTLTVHATPRYLTAPEP